MSRVFIAALWIGCLVGAGACRSSPDQAVRVGTWRGVLRSPGGELPFGLTVPPPGGVPEILNDVERVRMDRLRRDNGRLRFEIDVYDAVLEATLQGDRMTGTWRKRAPQGTSELPFEATFGYPHRFTPPKARAPENGPASVAGTWTMTFTDRDGPYPGQAELTQTGARVTGTILTATGDYRYLDGDYHAGRLRLSTFDGAHAFLFTARAQANGSLEGDFWSRDTYHATFTAHPKTAEEGLPDPYREVSLQPGTDRLTFRFPDAHGKMVSSNDARFAGRVLLIEVFGTWCPNCNDLAPLLVQWHRRYRDRGLEIVGLAYEFTDDPEEVANRLHAYATRHNIEFPILRAGISDKAAASETLPALDRIKSYPTSIFVARDGTVSKIHSGFTGPATGEHYRRMVREMEAEIDRLLSAAP